MGEILEKIILNSVINKLKTLYCNHFCVYSFAGYQTTARWGRCDQCVSITHTGFVRKC